MSAIVAFAGIDGAGKSTLVDRLEAQRVFPDAAYARKAVKTNVELVKRFHAQRVRTGRDWTEGPFAEAAAVATCFDFLEHYRTKVEPLLDDVEVVICDRYSICFEAYVRSTGSRFDAAALFGRVRPPDLTVFVDVPIPVALRRYDARGGPSEDEDERVMVRFRRAYEDLMSNVAEKIVIRNDGPLQETWRELTANLDRWQSARRGRRSQHCQGGTR